jgi:hypothetical protein
VPTTDTKSKILVISWSLPSEPIAMATVVENIARQFTKDQMVIAGEKDPSVDYSDRKVINDISIEFITFKLGSRKLLTVAQLPFSLLKLLIVLKEHHVSKILAIYPTEIFLFMGYFASLLTGKPLYLYFVNTYVENRHTFLRPLHIFFQKMLFNRAKHIFVMSEGMVALYNKNYPQLRKCSALVHTFNEAIPCYESYKIDGQVNFYFSGNVNDSCREAAIRLFNIITAVPNYHLTVSPAVQKPTLTRYGINIERITFKSVKRENLIAEMRKADIMLLPHGFYGALSKDEYDTIFPTKVIEYLISGKVIFLHASESSFLTRFFRTHGCALIVSEPDEQKILEGITRLKNDPGLREKLIRNALKTAKLFYAPTVLNQFKKILEIEQ